VNRQTRRSAFIFNTLISVYYQKQAAREVTKNFGDCSGVGQTTGLLVHGASGSRGNAPPPRTLDDSPFSELNLPSP